MSYKINYNKEENYIAVIVEGQFSLPTVKELAADVANLVEQYHCTRILNDLRNARLTEKIFDIYSMPKNVKQAGVGPHLKRALVVSELSSNFHFLETVFINQGHIVKMFTDINTALHWLLNKEKMTKNEPGT